MSTNTKWADRVCAAGVALLVALALFCAVMAIRAYAIEGTEKSFCETADGTYMDGVCIDNEAVIWP